MTGLKKQGRNRYLCQRDMKAFYQLASILLILTSYSCASSGELQGGPKDTEAPKLVVEKSSPNFALRNTQRSFVFTFDEFVEVKDVIKQVLVSPPLVYIPRIKARGKEVTFEFNEKEALKENTTYIIQFGEAIRDFTEQNKVQNFKHVFSTGDVIDSLQLKGRVTDETKGEGVAGISVLLYDDLLDSAIIRRKPFYFTRTDASGNFELSNLRNDTFRLVAIKDENNNLQFDELNELIGFDNRFVSWGDTIVEKRDLVLFKTEVEPLYSGYKHKARGLLGIKWHTEPKTAPVVKLEPEPAEMASWLKGDSLVVYYHYTTPMDSFWLDTGKKRVRLAMPDTTDIPRSLTVQTEFGSVGIVPGDTLWFDWERPIAAIDERLISLGDSSTILKFNIVKAYPKKTGIFAPMLPKQAYNLTILPGAFKDVYGNTHDTLSQSIKTFATEKLSQLKLEVVGLDSTKQYLVSLLKANKILNTTIIRNASHQILSFDRLKSDTYSVQIIEDTNANGKLDAASYWEQKPAEKMKQYTLEKLRESWTLETKVDYREAPQPAPNNPGIR